MEKKHTLSDETETLPEFALVILTQGFVYAGYPTRCGDYLRISGASNVRISGTTRGFGELATDGPNSKTKLDPCPEVLAPMAAVVHIMKVTAKPF